MIIGQHVNLPLLLGIFHDLAIRLHQVCHPQVDAEGTQLPSDVIVLIP